MNHWTTLSMHHNVNEIIDSLKSNFEIDSFIYRKAYADGKRIYLTSHPERTKWCFQNNIFMHDAYQAAPKNYKSGCAIWPFDEKHSSITDQMKERFGFTGGLSLIEANDNEIEIFSFNSASSHHSSINKLINNQDFLKRFTDHFRDKARDLIKHAELTAMIDLSPYLSKNSSIDDPLKISHSHLLNIPLKKFDSLSNRELQCVRLLTQGNTIKHIAKILQLSPRTVETFLNRSKLKLHALNQKDLISKIAQSIML